METKYFFMGYDFFSKLRDGQAKRRKYEDAINKAVAKQNKEEERKVNFIQKRPTHINKLGKKEPIYEDVIKTISECDTAIFDLTSRVSIYEYNLNVIFELGAAYSGHLSAANSFPRWVVYLYHNQTSEDKSEVEERIARDISDLSLPVTEKETTGKRKYGGMLSVYENYNELINLLSEVLIRRSIILDKTC